MRSYPWWQKVETLQGVGPTTRSVTIDEGSIQWRVKWSCESGRLVVEAPSQARPLVDANCPRSDVGYATRPGPISLDIRAEGPWQLEVEQQIDVPLVEPPLAAMTAPDAAVVAGGQFYNLDQTGRGRVTVYRLVDNTYALRLDEFFVTPNVDLEVLLSPLPAPQTTAEFRSAPSALVSRLDATAGSMNFALPPEVDPALYGSVVIWCPPVFSAYAAATLAPPQP